MNALRLRDDTGMSGNMYPGQSSINDGLSPEAYKDMERAILIKWSVLGGIFLFLVMWITIGHIHARRRLRKGLPLLFYHRVSDF